MRISRRLLLAFSAALVGACSTPPPAQPPQDTAGRFPPIIFVHGNGENASIWQTQVWRFESNGWPRDRLYAIDLPYPLARDDDAKPQAGRTSAAEHMAFLKSEVEKVLARTGAKKVVLFGNSRGGNAIRNYVYNGGDKTVSHAILGGTSNHGVWTVPIPGLPDGSEFAGQGPLLTALNRPKDEIGSEVAGPVHWMTIRSDRNDKYAQPDALWLGFPGVATGVSYAGPELKGAINVAIPRIDHRETGTSAPAFHVAYPFITGQPATTVDVVPEAKVGLAGKVAGLGLNPLDPATGNYPDNLPLPGARLDIFAVDNVTGERRGGPAYTKVIGADGQWGPFAAERDTRYEFVLAAPGYATTHIYRSPFPRSSSIVNLRPERVPDADKNAPSLVIMSRPRGYLDPARDKMAFDGQSPPPGAVLGAGVATSRIKPAGLPRPVVAEFNGERVVGRSWPLNENHVSVLEVTY